MDPHPLHIQWFYPPSIGGIGTLLWDMAHWFQEKEVPAHFLVGPLEGEKKRQELGNVVIERNDCMDIKKKGRETGEAAFNRICEIIDEEGANIIHVHNFHVPANITHTLAACSASTVKDVPIVLHAHGFSGSEIESLLLRHLNWDKIICVSNFIAEQVLSADIDSKRIETVHNSVDTIKFNPNLDEEWLSKRLGLEKKTRILLVSSRLMRVSGESTAESKGHFTILQAASHLAHVMPDFKIVFTGQDVTLPGKCESAMEKLRERAEVLDIEDKLLFPKKPLTMEEMPLAYAGCDVMALPSHDEAFGLVFTEAMACGRVAIGSNSGGVPEIINSGKNGMLVEEKNPVELFKAMERILTDPIFSLKLGVNARKTVEEKFSTDKMCKGVMEVYEELL